MGTRNLTMVIDREGQYKVAQYGQWDGYPSGQGVTILNFAKDKSKMERLENELKNIKFYNRCDDLNDYIKSHDERANARTRTEEDKYFFDKLLTRNLCADILNSIITLDKGLLPKELNKTIYLCDEFDFGKDSLFCEWAYCINFQTNKLECFAGFNKSKDKQHPRFYVSEDEQVCEGYYGISLIKEYDLDDLPSKEEFIKELNEEVEEDVE